MRKVEWGGLTTVIKELRRGGYGWETQGGSLHKGGAVSHGDSSCDVKSRRRVGRGNTLLGKTGGRVEDPEGPWGGMDCLRLTGCPGRTFCQKTRASPEQDRRALKKEQRATGNQGRRLSRQRLKVNHQGGGGITKQKNGGY